MKTDVKKVTKLLKAIIELLVDHPEEVKVIEGNNGHFISYKISVSADDKKKLIGRNGRTIGSMLLLARAMINSKGEARNVVFDVND